MADKCMSPEFIQALLIGVLVMLAIYIGLQRAFGEASTSVRRAIAIFAAVVGILTMLWLQENPGSLEDYSAQIVAAGVAVVLALLALARRSSE